MFKDYRLAKEAEAEAIKNRVALSNQLGSEFFETWKTLENESKDMIENWRRGDITRLRLIMRLKELESWNMGESAGFVSWIEDNLFVFNILTD